MEIFYIIIWVIGAFLVGALGRERVCGFGQAFLFSLIFSPFVGIVFTLASQSLVDQEYQKKVLELLRMIANKD
jgi:uncharacterized membrane protein YhdT